MSLFLLDVAVGPIIFIAFIVLLIILAVVITLIYFAIKLIRNIKKAEDEEFFKNYNKD